MMNPLKLPKSELQILERLWAIGPASVREISDSLTEEQRPAYTTIQTLVSRLEQKGAVRRVKKVGSAIVFEAVLTRKSVHRRLVNELLDLLGGSAAPLMSHLIDTGKLTLADLREAEERLKKAGSRNS